MRKTLPIRVLTLALVPAGWAVLAAVATGLPVFNSAVQRVSVTGGWATADSTAHYDRAEYLFHLGYDYVNDFGMFYDEDRGEMALISVEERAGRTKTGEALLRESLRLDPANAHIWAGLAQAQSRLGNTEHARESLSKSWQLAPYNLRLASVRLTLASRLRVDRFTSEERQALLRDKTLLETNAPAELSVLTTVSKDIAELTAGL